jgi:hypothetical protein
MLHQRNGYERKQVAQLPSGRPLLAAAYRRGVFRAKVGIHELTSVGAVIECMENPPAGTMVWLTFHGLEARAAYIEESCNFRLVLRFAEKLHPAVVDAVRGGQLRRYH